MKNSLLMKHLEREIKKTKSTLAASIKTMQSRLGEASMDLASGREPNALGIVQSLGAEIDRLIGELNSLTKIRDYWKNEDQGLLEK